MVSTGNNPNKGNQKGGLENSNASDKKDAKDKAGKAQDKQGGTEKPAAGGGDRQNKR